MLNGTPALGEWQQISHPDCEMKRRDREIVVTVQGDQNDEAVLP